MNRLAAFLPALLAGSAAWSQSVPPGKVALLPSRVEAAQDFDIKLIGSEFSCATEFSHLSVHQDKGISLTYYAKNNPAVRCAPKTAPLGPEFKLKGLAAGTYSVRAYVLTDCLIQPMPCLLIPPSYAAGTLTVGPLPTADTGWRLAPRQYPADSALEVMAVHPGLSSCKQAFRHNKVTRLKAAGTGRDSGFALEFSQVDLARSCSTAVKPFGPLFELPPLSPGRYPVTGYALPECALVAPICVPLRPWEPAFRDTLVVSRDLPSALVPEAKVPGIAKSPRVRVASGSGILTLTFDLTPSEKVSAPILIASDGRSMPLAPLAGSETSAFRLPEGLRPGAYRLAWRGPEGLVRSAPFAYLP